MSNKKTILPISANLEQIKECVECYLGDSEIMEHSQRVCDICQEIMDELKISKDSETRELIYKAAYLHDIGKANKLKKKFDKDIHNFASAIAITWLFDCGGTEKNMHYAKKIQEIVIAHKGDFAPDADVAVEAAILRMADKIEKYYDPVEDTVKKRCTDNLEKIEKFFEKKEIEDFKNIKKACKTIRKCTKGKASAI